MQEAKHTPGPWNIGRSEDEYPNIVAEGTLNDTCFIATDLHGPDKEANARLIAAAPEMLEAAIEVMTLLDGHGLSIVPLLLDSDENAGQRLRDAIARATGSEAT